MRMVDDQNKAAVSFDKVGAGDWRWRLSWSLGCWSLGWRLGLGLETRIRRLGACPPLTPLLQLMDQLDYAPKRFSKVAEYFGQNLFRQVRTCHPLACLLPP